MSLSHALSRLNSSLFRVTMSFPNLTSIPASTIRHPDFELLEKIFRIFFVPYFTMRCEFRRKNFVVSRITSSLMHIYVADGKGNDF